MRIILLITALLVNFSHAELIETNSRLPSFTPLWLADRPDNSVQFNEFECDFVEQREILRVSDGNSVIITYLVTYRVRNRLLDTDPEELKFIATDTDAHPESGIMLKKHAWPFVEDIPRVFYLQHDKAVEHIQYYNIIWHDLKMIRG